LREHYPELFDYVKKIENKYGTVCFMDKWEQNYMLKLSKPCYRDEFANLNQYEVTIIEKYLKGDINVRQLSYYLGRIMDEEADRKAQLYRIGRYELTNRRNYWELKRRNRKRHKK